MRSLIFSGIITALSITAAQAQGPATALRPDLNTDSTKVFNVVEQQPVFNGSWSSFLQQKLVFPRAVLDRMDTDTTLAKTGISERVIVRFIVCEDGGLCNMEVVKCNPQFPELGREAMRVLRPSPAWKPGLNNGAPVKTYYAQPIYFKTE